MFRRDVVDSFVLTRNRIKPINDYDMPANLASRPVKSKETAAAAVGATTHLHPLKDGICKFTDPSQLIALPAKSPPDMMVRVTRDGSRPVSPFALVQQDVQEKAVIAEDASPVMDVVDTSLETAVPETSTSPPPSIKRNDAGTTALQRMAKRVRHSVAGMWSGLVQSSSYIMEWGAPTNPQWLHVAQAHQNYDPRSLLYAYGWAY